MCTVTLDLDRCEFRFNLSDEASEILLQQRLTAGYDQHDVLLYPAPINYLIEFFIEPSVNQSDQFFILFEIALLKHGITKRAS